MTFPEELPGASMTHTDEWLARLGAEDAIKEEVLTADLTVRSLVELESVIEKGLRTFVEVGLALQEISERRLYREQGFDTFEGYCKQRWGLARPTAYKYIESAKVAVNVSTYRQNDPSLSQAFELASLPADEQLAVAGEVKFEQITVQELKEIVKEVKAGTPPAMAVHFSSASEEWYTPPEIIERTLKALGTIDLDPCSNAQKNIPAKRHLAQVDDGLLSEWRGRIYMNPPYGRAIVEWVQHLVSEHAAGRVSQAIALVPARVDTDWFRLLRDFAVCFIDGRLKFSGHQNSAPFPSAVVYLGENIKRFNGAFADMGDIWIRWKGGPPTG